MDFTCFLRWKYRQKLAYLCRDSSKEFRLKKANKHGTLIKTLLTLKTVLFIYFSYSLILQFTWQCINSTFCCTLYDFWHRRTENLEQLNLIEMKNVIKPFFQHHFNHYLLYVKKTQGIEGAFRCFLPKMYT